MNMKAFALAVVATAGLLLSASTADAQYRSRGSYRTYSYPAYSYSYPTYGYSTSSYSTYSYPTFGSVAPTYYDNGVVVTSGYTPTYSPMVYPSGYTYPASGFGSYYNSPSYYGGGYNSYYGTPYNGVNINRSGVNVGGRSIWRW
jgi:hypothetical protein